MAEKIQFNVQLPAPLATKIRADARRNGRTLDDVAAAIFGDFFNGWNTEERAKFYTACRTKKVGRKIFLPGAIRKNPTCETENTSR